MYLSASAVAVSTWGAITSVRPLLVKFHSFELVTDVRTTEHDPPMQRERVRSVETPVLFSPFVD